MAIEVQKLLLLLLPLFISIFPSISLEDGFVQCFSSNTPNPNATSQIIFTQKNPSFKPILQSSIRNLMFSHKSTPKPILIVTPHNISHIQSAITCSKQQGLQVRVRSGGHDYEGLSYTSHEEEDQPFIILDFSNLRSITINLEDETAWVESGATLGELYHAIAKASRVHGFPAGSCPTIGIGGHLSGGGFGTIFRKYGLAADNVVDAVIVDSHGRLLNRTLMGEDLFWAIRGGGGSSFGVITSWKVKLVRVPETVTIFDISTRVVEDDDDDDSVITFMKWQDIADKLPGEMFLHAVMGIENVNSSSSSSSNKAVTISFTGLYLGEADVAVSLMSENFAELGLQRNNCKQMSWIQSVLYFAGFSVNSSIDLLTQRNQTSRISFKAKSDYVTSQQSIPLSGLKGLWKILLHEDNSPLLILTPYGGRMSEISESESPFPHRKGINYGIQYIVSWDNSSDDEKYLEMMRRLYEYMTPYVSENPRRAYLNYRDLDLGVNRDKNTSYEEARTSWGSKYFKNNFERLAKVKAAVDLGNFFWNEQSIPPLI
ncbi:berberine bridge enzyme-like 26 [Prosopis cineraria]|uniref:berberine bridge enzyme-like 26 n=1 Tax=Prosopis cineraria TaxID=364024 RepID=UPI00241044D4|nr:berberine bridge enzyme-like 26 [Prosopis cineraria]